MLRKATLLSAVAGAALFASTASADVNVTAFIDKFVDYDINERTDKDKFIDVDVFIDVNPEKFAQASAHFNQRNTNNFACENCAEKVAIISASILSNVGITSTNQAAGNNNLQGNVIAFSFDFDDPTPPVSTSDGFAHAQVAGTQYNNAQVVVTDNLVFRDAFILNSINGNVGITTTNQSVGNMTNQANAIAVAFSANPGVALSDEALGQFVVGNVVVETNVSKYALISGSINGNLGITQTNQTSGTVINQANVVSLSVTGN